MGLKCTCIKKNGYFEEGKEYEYEKLMYKSGDYTYKVHTGQLYLKTIMLSWLEFKKHFDSEEKTARKYVRHIRNDSKESKIDKTGQGENLRNKRKTRFEAIEVDTVTTVKVQKSLNNNNILIYDKDHRFVWQGPNPDAYKKLRGQPRGFFKAKINIKDETLELISKVQDQEW